MKSGLYYRVEKKRFDFSQMRAHLTFRSGVRGGWGGAGGGGKLANLMEKGTSSEILECKKLSSNLLET